jgi:hypothetical protein
MRRRMPRLALLAVALACPLPAAAASAPAGFHDAASEPERALAAILKAADADDNQLDNLLAGRGAPNFRPTVDYGRVLTTPLRRAIAAAEKTLLDQACGGRYRAGEICGLDFSPLTCAQDAPARYLFRTDAARGEAARISTAWPSAPKPVATYRLVKQAGRWMIDGIVCRSDDPASPSTGFNLR